MTTDNTNENENSYLSSRNSTVIRFRPYPYLNDAIKAAEHYTSLKSSPTDKRKIIERLLITDEFFRDVSPIMISAFPRMESPIRHLILDNIIRLIHKGEDFTVIAGEIARLMTDKNFNLREKAALLLQHMGENAAPAIPRVVSYLRSRLPDVQHSAIKVLAAIGPVAADASIPKLKAYLNSNALPAEYRELGQKTLQILRGEEKPIRPDIKIEGVLESSGNETAKSDTKAEGPAEHTLQYLAIKGKSIVIAEDQESVRSMIRRALTACGATTKETYDGEIVLKMLQAKLNIDLFILDLMMPNISGAEVLKEIRENPQYKLTPVIIVSARTERSIKLKMAQLEVSAYFSKPFKLTELLSCINSIFSQ